MYKEIIISVIIVITILCVDIISSNYTKQSVEEIETCFENFRNELEKDVVDENKIKFHMEEVKEKWHSRYEILAFYVEHDELEKVETEVSALNAKKKKKKYEEAIEKLERSEFILKHISDKEDFNFKNIF